MISVSEIRFISSYKLGIRKAQRRGTEELLKQMLFEVYLKRWLGICQTDGSIKYGCFEDENSMLERGSVEEQGVRRGITTLRVIPLGSNKMNLFSHL